MIQVNNLVYTYRNNPEPSVCSISFSVNKGEIFGFLGPSGAGKSTTQKILIKLLSNYNGEVAVGGKSLTDWDSSIYQKIGVGFELPNHYAKLTAVENLNFFASFYDNNVIPPFDLLKKVGLEEAANKKTEAFSKGMKMRLNFVRALMHKPEILFLDEPTSGLDPANARNVKDIILEQKSHGKTIFLTTHNMHDAEELCDRIAFIVNGELKVIDTPQNLKLQNGKRVIKVEYGSSPGTFREFPLDNLGANKTFLELIRTEYILSMHTKEAGLDDIFIKLTGTNLNQE